MTQWQQFRMAFLKNFIILMHITLHSPTKNILPTFFRTFLHPPPCTQLNYRLRRDIVGPSLTFEPIKHINVCVRWNNISLYRRHRLVFAHISRFRINSIKVPIRSDGKKLNADNCDNPRICFYRFCQCQCVVWAKKTFRRYLFCTVSHSYQVTTDSGQVLRKYDLCARRKKN